MITIRCARRKACRHHQASNFGEDWGCIWAVNVRLFGIHNHVPNTPVVVSNKMLVESGDRLPIMKCIVCRSSAKPRV